VSTRQRIIAEVRMGLIVRRYQTRHQSRCRSPDMFRIRRVVRMVMCMRLGAMRMRVGRMRLGYERQGGMGVGSRSPRVGMPEEAEARHRERHQEQPYQGANAMLS
jgi:hypothetical protein